MSGGETRFPDVEARYSRFSHPDGVADGESVVIQACRSFGVIRHVIPPDHALLRCTGLAISKLSGGIYLSKGHIYIDSNTIIGVSSTTFTTIVARRIKIDSNANPVVRPTYDLSSGSNRGTRGLRPHRWCKLMR